MALTRPPRAPRRTRANAWRTSALDSAPVRNFDFLLVGATFAIAVIGLVMIWSTTRHRIPGDQLYFVKRQAMFLVVGVLAMAAVLAVDYRRLRDHSMFAYLATVGLLLAVLAPLGSNIKGHQAWFQLPGGFTLQPSELAKFGIIVALAGYCNQYRGELDAWRLTTILTLAAVPIGLVLLQPDLGTVLVLGAIIIGLLTVAGVTGRQLFVLALLAVSGVFVVVNLGLLKDYQIERFNNFIDPGSASSQGSAYNQEQSKQAIAHGRTLGEGLGNGSQTQGGFVPEQHTDFIFTSVGEELGFVGAMVLLGLFAIVMWRTWRTARLSRDFFGTLVCTGVLAMLAFQVFENVGMTVGIMPIAGIPLPLMSYGGSSLITTFACVGLVANVSMRRFS
ncbi:MAG TPA: rod shape-determining protein RodA [Acidimicrobiia bacterium]